MRELLIQPYLDNFEECVNYSKSTPNLKFEIVDFAFASILDNQKEIDKRIEFYLDKEISVKFETMHGAFIDLYLPSDDENIFKYAEKMITKNFEIAKKVGVKNLVFHSNYIPQLMRASYKENWLNRSAELYSKLINTYGVGVFIENIFDWHPEPLKELVLKINSDKFKVCFDTGHINHFANFSPQKRSVKEWIDVLGQDIKYLHLNDNMGDYDSELSVGKGNFKWNEFSNSMVNNRIEAQTVFEVKDMKAVDESIDFLEKNKYYPFNE